MIGRQACLWRGLRRSVGPDRGRRRVLQLHRVVDREQSEAEGHPVLRDRVEQIAVGGVDPGKQIAIGLRGADRRLLRVPGGAARNLPPSSESVVVIRPSVMWRAVPASTGFACAGLGSTQAASGEFAGSGGDDIRVVGVVAVVVLAHPTGVSARVRTTHPVKRRPLTPITLVLVHQLPGSHRTPREHRDTSKVQWNRKGAGRRTRLVESLWNSSRRCRPARRSGVVRPRRRPVDLSGLAATGRGGQTVGTGRRRGCGVVGRVAWADRPPGAVQASAHGPSRRSRAAVSCASIGSSWTGVTMPRGGWRRRWRTVTAERC